ncbi:orotidine-5'-phosphate decarboxylase [Helicobacter jaachi]|uniref:Orotidine 5'-phosphate decarboxylase n=1 Tax=Helicobacter jaachi TaxID=1677920 RepID=A0A4U8TC58_9HELI|nr:orotidine-5'-phosphate decarboxylase [Helicobacter jaachi]TLD96217.1 orotidine-5'-phosphate decarboxylase [Helicobacter jaachi]
MKLCIALDNPTLQENCNLLRALDSISNDKKEKIWLKIGLRSFIRDGINGLERVKTYGNYRIFLDLKLYDIPNTMLDAITECQKLGIDMLTIHTSCGFEAMKMIADSKHKAANSPLIVGVSALTSFDNEGFAQIYNAQLFSHTLKLSSLAYKAGIDGVVCSVQESRAIKRVTSKDFLTITPGVRPFGENPQDQKRVASLQDALNAQSDFVVIGRPIYKAENPLEVVSNILEVL